MHIALNAKQLETLLNGGVVSTASAEIVLSDIGWAKIQKIVTDGIANAAKVSPAPWAAK